MILKWKFRDVSPSPNNPGAFYEQAWPADMPPSCQICGTKFRASFNITHGAGKAGRIMRSIAYWGFLPCIGIAFLIPLFFPEHFTHSEGFRGNIAYHAFFGTMFIPPALLGGLSVIMPKSRHLECKKCGWNRDYKPAPLPRFKSTSGKT